MATIFTRCPSPLGTPGISLNTIKFDSANESRFFHHFRVCTRYGLADSAGLRDFWDAYTLPLAHQEEPLRRTIAAVGAAHQLYVIKSYSTTPSSLWITEQENAAMQQYNKAISSLLKVMSTLGSPTATHSILLCCLMFVCFESLMGRYSESIKHIKSGFQLLASSDASGNIGDADLWWQIYGMFARLGIEFSAYMDDLLVPPVPKNTNSPAASTDGQQPFTNLIEATSSLRELDLQHWAALWHAEYAVSLDGEGSACHVKSENRLHLPLTAGPYSGSEAAGTVPTVVNDPLWDKKWNDKFNVWNSRFELLVDTLQPEKLSERELGLLGRLRLQQSFWKFALELPHDGTEAENVPTSSYECFMERAEQMAQPLIAQGKPTFSLDGDLISDLSFTVRFSRDPAAQSRALFILRSLNRREGIWDSNEIADMYEAALSLRYDKIWELQDEVRSVPAFMKILSEMAQDYKPTSLILWMTSMANS
ncbi:uncharacterized protein PG998_014376 [Apiospora kogelbergensis]|uniref:uncharacterized protein n=1 Tax=Apiospora kogelbergensis TaxID=1337665 RepID=UPI0031321A03